jgi:hypothetical protein
VFGDQLAEAWQKRRSEEEAIAATYAATVEQITAFLNALARSVSEVTGAEAKVSETKRVVHVSTQSLVTHHCITHPSGVFHVRLHHEARGVEYHRRVVEPANRELLYGLIANEALTHFGPKPI